MKDSASHQADDGECGPTPFVVDPVDEKLEEGEREGMGLPHPGYTSPDFSSPGSLPSSSSSSSSSSASSASSASSSSSSSSAERGGGHDVADTAGDAGRTGGSAGTGDTDGTGGAGGETSSDAPDQRLPARDAADDGVPGFSAPEFTSPGFGSPDIPTGPQLGETETGRRMRAEQQGEDAVTPVPLPEAHRPPQPPRRRG